MKLVSDVPAAAPLLEVEALSVHYRGIRAVDGAAFLVRVGELVALTGANGAGKSSVLKALSGLVASTGVVRFGGRILSDMPAYRRVRLGLVLVPEGRELFAGMTVIENLVMGAYLRLGSRPRAPEQDLDRVFGLFPALADRRRQEAGTLSGGEQQMLALGRALMSRPKLLVCDEPSTGLAPRLVTQIIRTLGLLRDQGVAVLLAEQNARAALSVADRGYVFENGQVVLGGPANELLNDPAVVNAYLGEVADPGSQQ
jgi:branched-chain amino acid transport system ATP-binding protein